MLRHRRRRTRPILWAILLLMPVSLPASPAKAQPRAETPQPDRLTLGSVRVGATVEASVRIFENGDDTTGLRLQVEPPSFLRVRQTHLGTQTFGDSGTFIVCDIMVSLNTTQAGELRAPLRVQLGNRRLEIPISADVSATEEGETRLLVVDTPFQRFSTDDATVFAPWLELVKAAKLNCHYLEVDRGHSVLRDLDLATFDVILLAGSGLFFAQEEDVTKLRKFIDDGGRVIVAANHFFMGTVAKANQLLVPCGLEMKDSEPRGVNLFEIREGAISEHSLMKDVRVLRVHRPSPTIVLDQTKDKILAAYSDDLQEGFVAVATSGKGEVVSLGASLWWNWIASEHQKGFDNALLLKSLLTKPRE